MIKYANIIVIARRDKAMHSGGVTLATGEIRSKGRLFFILG
jgi:hypothetical protein